MNINREELLKKSKEDLIDYFIDIIQKLNTRITELEKGNKKTSKSLKRKKTHLLVTKHIIRNYQKNLIKPLIMI